MPNLRDIRTRIAGVEKTQKIVSAMKMVAAAKLARAQSAINAARPYAETLRSVLASVSAGVEADAHPLLVSRKPARKLDVVLLTSNRGLCGAFNANMSKEAAALIAARETDTESISLIPIGRKGAERFAKLGLPKPCEWVGVSGVTQELGAEIAATLMERFLAGEADETILVYGEFRSALRQIPRQQLLLPVRPEGSEREVDSSTYEIEPGPEQLLGQLVPRAVEFAVFRSLLENDASEHGARMTAMDSATSNTEDLIRTLTLDYNKERQAAITAELVEIVGGAESL